MINQENDFKIVYSLSNVRDLIRDCLRSLKTLNRFIDKNNIIIFYTPPRNYKTYNKLKKRAEVKEVDNISEPFWFTNNRGYLRAGEKIHLCNVNNENIIFLDCDTIVKRNPLELLNYDFDFMGRIEKRAMAKFDLKKWNNMFKKFNKKPIPMFNTGFMIFKNYTHRKIKNDWIKYSFMDLPKIHPLTYQKEQYALSLALSVFKIKYMSNREHAFRWYDEEKINTYILHGTHKKTLLRTIKTKIRKSLK